MCMVQCRRMLELMLSVPVTWWMDVSVLSAKLWTLQVTKMCPSWHTQPSEIDNLNFWNSLLFMISLLGPCSLKNVKEVKFLFQMFWLCRYASAFYGPFREALDSNPRFGDKKTWVSSDSFAPCSNGMLTRLWKCNRAHFGSIFRFLNFMVAHGSGTKWTLQTTERL